MEAIQTIPLLSNEECEEIWTTLKSLRPNWTERGGGIVPFYTFGAACYLDHPERKKSAYRDIEAKINPLLRLHFAPLLNKVRSAVEQATGKNASYEHLHALPGFHIFLFHPLFEKPQAHLHFDLQQLQVKWPFKEVDRTHPLSFTLPITLPRSGSGLNYWDLPWFENRHRDEGELEELSKKTPKLFLSYELGTMVLHSGQFLHQIAPCPGMTEADTRVTLQGHAMFCDGAWRLYW